MSWKTNKGTGKKFQSRGKGIDSATFDELAKQDRDRKSKSGFIPSSDSGAPTKPLPNVIPLLGQKVFYHATKKQNAQNILKNGFDHSMIGKASENRIRGSTYAMFGFGPASGAGYYVAKKKDTALNYGGTVLEIQLKDDAKILDLEPYWLQPDPPKLPILDDIRKWYPEYLVVQRQKNLGHTEEQAREWVYKTYVPNDLEYDMRSIDPRTRPKIEGGDFDYLHFMDIMRNYAKDHGLAGINFDSTDTVIFDNKYIKSIRLVSKK